MRTNSFEKMLTYVFLGLLLVTVVAGTANAFDFTGYTYNVTKGALSDTNITIEVYTMGGGPPTLIAAPFNLSNASGYFNVSSIPEDNNYVFAQ